MPVCLCDARNKYNAWQWIGIQYIFIGWIINEDLIWSHYKSILNVPNQLSFPFTSAAIFGLFHPSKAQCFASLMLSLIFSFTEEIEVISWESSILFTSLSPTPSLKGGLHLKLSFSFSFIHVEELFYCSHLFLRDFSPSVHQCLTITFSILPNFQK